MRVALPPRCRPNSLGHPKIINWHSIRTQILALLRIRRSHQNTFDNLLRRIWLTSTKLNNNKQCRLQTTHMRHSSRLRCRMLPCTQVCNKDQWWHKQCRINNRCKTFQLPVRISIWTALSNINKLYRKVRFEPKMITTWAMYKCREVRTSTWGTRSTKRSPQT